MDAADLTVIVPTLNEEKNIGRLITAIHDILPQTQILVVDDGSTDDTQSIVSSSDAAQLLDRSDEEIKGLSASIKDGIATTKTKFFMVIDGDFQHPPDSLLEAITCFQRGADLVVGYRIKVENWPFTRKLMSWGAQNLAYVSLLIRRRQRPRDIMSGYFGGNTGEINELLGSSKVSLKGYKILFDLLKILPNNYDICQFGYIFKNREFGTSKIGKTQIWEFIKSLV